MLRSSSLQPAALLSQAREPPSGWPSEAKQCDEQGCWPKLFILGTQKGATTSLFQLLHNEGSACGSITNQRIESALPNLKGAFNGDTGMAKEPHKSVLWFVGGTGSDWLLVIYSPRAPHICGAPQCAS